MYQNPTQEPKSLALNVFKLHLCQFEIPFKEFRRETQVFEGIITDESIKKIERKLALEGPKMYERIKDPNRKNRFYNFHLNITKMARANNNKKQSTFRSN